MDNISTLPEYKCIHGVCSGTKCFNCAIEHRLIFLQNSINHIYEVIEKCFNKIEQLEKHKNYQTEENRKISLRFDELERKNER
jgi:hypothetical protein